MLGMNSPLPRDPLIYKVITEHYEEKIPDTLFGEMAAPLLSC
ncbi:hypothetical protein BLGI_4769 [Brevibacillus laterosporus GI-9]|nr:hypothetical protein BLGI_4769 [Brevibacillus laterosporus GI-9]